MISKLAPLLLGLTGFNGLAGSAGLDAMADATVTLPMEAHVRGTEVELGEVAEITCADSVLALRLGAIELGTAPAPGYSRVFAADTIRAALLRDAPGVAVVLAGQRACRVYPEVEEVSAETILLAAREELERSFGPREASFTPNGVLPAVNVPAGTAQTSIRARPATAPSHSGTVNVPVDVLVEGVRYRTVWTSWDVRVWETRSVLARNVRAGQELRPEMFVRKRIQLEAGAGNAPLAKAQVVGAVALRDLSPGELVSRQDVHRPPVVAIGDTVFLRVKKGAIQARVSASVLEIGSVGDRIRIRTGAGQELLAIVKSRDLCEIDLGA